MTDREMFSDFLFGHVSSNIQVKFQSIFVAREVFVAEPTSSTFHLTLEDRVSPHVLVHSLR